MLARASPKGRLENLAFIVRRPLTSTKSHSHQFHSKNKTSSFSYVMMLVEMLASPESGEALSNVAALRTFRVLRALKTVAVVPGKPEDLGFVLSLRRGWLG